jgi:hypothetical protein
VNRHEVVAAAREKGVGEEISFEEMSAYFLRMKETAGGVADKGKKKGRDTVRTADGRILEKWRPREVGKKGVTGR